MNSNDLNFILWEKFPDLLTVEEKEDMDFVPNRFSTPDLPPKFNQWFQILRPNPEAMERREFETRPPALGLTSSVLDELHSHLQLPGLKSVQKRHIFHILRNAMLRALIPCSDISDVEDLITI